MTGVVSGVDVSARMVEEVEVSTGATAMGVSDSMTGTGDGATTGSEEG